MDAPTDTQLVFADLADALEVLDVERASPKNVRRAFSRYVELTQRLTAVMRRDYSRLKGTNWSASSFEGWNNVTAFFKWLRNEDQHGLQIYISVHERRFYPITNGNERLFAFEGTWELVDQMTDVPPDGITFQLIDPTTGQLSDVVVPPVRIEYQYLLQPRTDEAIRRVREVGAADVHQLSRACFAVLEEYHKHFMLRVGG